MRPPGVQHAVADRHPGAADPDEEPERERAAAPRWPTRPPRRASPRRRPATGWPAASWPGPTSAAARAGARSRRRTGARARSKPVTRSRRGARVGSRAMVQISIRRVDPELPLPSYAHPGDAGADLHSAVDLTLQPGERALVPDRHRDGPPRGVRRPGAPALGARRAARHLDRQRSRAPSTRATAARSRSAWSTPTAHEPFTVRRGDRIAQLVIQRFETAGSWRPTTCRTRRAVPGATVRPGDSTPTTQTPDGVRAGGTHRREVRPQVRRRRSPRRLVEETARGGRPAAVGPFDASEVEPRGARVRRPRQPAGHARRRRWSCGSRSTRRAAR